MCGHGEHEIRGECEPRQIEAMNYRHFCPWAHTGYAQRRDEDLGSTSRSAPRVAMVQAADLRNRNDFAKRWRLDITRRWRVSIQRKMTPGIMVVVKVLGQDSLQMPFAQHDHMVQTFSTYRTDYPFAIRILPIRQLHLIVTVRHELFG